MTSIHKYYTTAIHTALLTVLILCVGSCSSDDPEVAQSPNDAYWKVSSTVSSSEGSSAIIITGTTGTEWDAEITEGSGWFSFSSKDYANSSKHGTINDGLNVLYVYYKSNTGREQRQAKLSLRFAGEEPQTFSLVQMAESQQNLPAFGAWVELPERKENANYQYVTHYGPLSNNKTVRNYSICFDKTKKAALWVAYPIHNAYLTGSGKRTDAWAFDPIIPIAYQANCIDKSYRGSYDRGHQLPSADRLATNELNAQTFYMSNMTPQLNRLNQDMWANLENKVRNNKCSDTLYVVTGAYFDSNATTYDGAGNIVSLPSNYYKVLLRTKSGSTGKAIKDCSADELISIGFWVEHKSYGQDIPRSICTKVADIEAKTGFTFFPQVSASVKQQNNPTQWGIN
ncbi:DNA/RNA non-specific endonuclease [Bacteroides salyersiae]|jgi:endonuclease G|uniref:DNA/RNA non-specific endonuclease n=1 Tax=Bacteroides salyersiae TaxID=291644 RepID=UPI001C8C185B|nr:DNA/RNA non-specific endonuclease [Bacteroides salyersiae]